MLVTLTCKDLVSLISIIKAQFRYYKWTTNFLTEEARQRAEEEEQERKELEKKQGIERRKLENAVRIHFYVQHRNCCTCIYTTVYCSYRTTVLLVSTLFC